MRCDHDPVHYWMYDPWGRGHYHYFECRRCHMALASGFDGGIDGDRERVRACDPREEADAGGRD